MSDPTPNRRRVDMIAAGLNAHTLHELAASHGLSLIKDAIMLMSDLGDNFDKALLVDYCIRHGGLTLVSKKVSRVPVSPVFLFIN